MRSRTKGQKRHRGTGTDAEGGEARRRSSRTGQDGADRTGQDRTTTRGVGWIGIGRRRGRGE